MTDDTKPAFEFDPLPGDAQMAQQEAERQGQRQAPAEQTPATPVERKRRGPKKGSKHGPRKTALAAESKTAWPIATMTAEFAEAQHQAGFSDEYDFLRALMQFPEGKRAHILTVINKVFGG